MADSADPSWQPATNPTPTGLPGPLPPVPRIVLPTDDPRIVTIDGVRYKRLTSFTPGSFVRCNHDDSAFACQGDVYLVSGTTLTPVYSPNDSFSGPKDVALAQAEPDFWDEISQTQVMELLR